MPDEVSPQVPARETPNHQIAAGVARLPTDEELRAVKEALGDALDRLQVLVWGLRRLRDVYMKDDEVVAVPTLDGLARLEAFRTGLSVDHWAVGKELKRLEELLEHLDMMRIQLSSSAAC